MYISGNLQRLRKRDKITQEELADKIGVSRQSVSKWETGEAYPETDKLIAICDLFGVSLDELMRSEITDRGTVIDDSDGESKASKASSAEFIAHMNAFSRAIAGGVMLIILGIAVCLVLCGFGEMFSGDNAQLLSVMGGVAVIVFVAAAVFLFIWFGLRHKRFCSENTVMESAYTVEQIKAFSKRFAVAMACLVSAILIDVVILIVFTTLLDTGVIAAANIDAAVIFVTAAFMAFMAVLVGGMVLLGITHSKYFIEEYNKSSLRAAGTSQRCKLIDAICGAIMMTATALFLVLGFVFSLWHPGWVVFPVGGIICGIVDTVMRVKDKDKDK